MLLRSNDYRKALLGIEAHSHDLRLCSLGFSFQKLNFILESTVFNDPEYRCICGTA